METKTLESKPHYLILDGLRGVAAILVVIFHLFEAHATSRGDQIINHGYLAVDFFFMLSGFVIGYAYDDRWKKMSIKDFFKRRIIRLQPMVVIGMVIGAAMIYFQKSEVFPLLGELEAWKVILVMLVGFFLIPLPPSMEIRGWGEMHPLNGPAWSLFYEYIANILYGLFIRRFSTTVIAILVFVSACVLVYMTTSQGDIVGGWALDGKGLYIGFTRLLYPFLTGLLLCRIGKLIHIKNAFLWCSLSIVVILALPRFGSSESGWINGLYESLSIIFLFPFIVLMGAGGEIKAKFPTKLCKFFGDISYPLYITHYPLIYTYFAIVNNNKLTMKEGAPIAIAFFLASILIAYLCLKLYDEPVRNWLKKKLAA